MAATTDVDQSSDPDTLAQDFNDQSHTSMEASYLVIHTVDCDGEGPHEDHPTSTSFLDSPRLYAGDSRASALRGKIPVEDVESYIQQQENVCLVVYKNYQCAQYHDSIKKEFRRTKLPAQQTTVSTKVWPFLYTLDQDGPFAVRGQESMAIISDELADWLRKISIGVRSSTNIPNPEHPTISVRPGSLQPPPPPDLYDEPLDVLRINAPYLGLYHQRQLVAQEIANRQDETKFQIQAMSTYLEQEYGIEYAEADALFAEGQVSKKHFHKLFGPNQAIVAVEENQPRAYMCKGVERQNEDLELECWTWTFDGSFRREESCHIVRWPSAKEDIVNIKALDKYPLRFDQTGLEDRLRARGEKFWSLRFQKFVGYRTSNPSFEIRTTNPRFMIDMRTYQTLHSMEYEEAEQKDTLSTEAMAKDRPPADEFTLLLPATILGYGFHDKKWRTLRLQWIEEVNWNTTAFRRIVLDPEKKEIIEALVSVHTQTPKSTDLIEGKGNGLVMLLHGSPGTGKTLTAESVAELTKRPLYRVTCGDMGTDPEAVEKYLDSVFHISTIWECVVLLDEADVFLEERSEADLARNALVSVFLRAVEYYDGILILTSNRVGRFDEAFKSRIQLAVHYPSLGFGERMEVWTEFVNGMLPDESDQVVHELKKHINILAQPNLNGRQIRNTIKSARQLAFHNRKELCYDHFKRVLKVAHEFEDYLMRTRGGTDDQLASEGYIRAK